MKMIDVLIKLANGEIKDQMISNYFQINDKFLNLEVELIPPKEND